MWNVVSVDDEPFVIDDDQKAEWAIRKIAEAQAEYARMVDWYKAQAERLKKQRDEKIERMKALLYQYMQTVPAKDTKTTRKWALPGGELVISKAKKDFACEDPEALLGWCIDNDPDMIKAELTPKWAEIKKRLMVTDAGIVDSQTGVKLVGVVTLDKPEEFKVKLKEDQ